MENAKPVDEAIYAELKARLDRYDAWFESIGTPGSYKPEDLPDDCKISNEERAQVEVYEWHRDKPANYFLYIKRPSTNSTTGFGTTWTGDVLGKVIFGCEFSDSFGGRRVPLRMAGSNGVNYYGTYYKSTGDFARIKRLKEKSG